jgi:hypothetical protein
MAIHRNSPDLRPVATFAPQPSVGQDGILRTDCQSVQPGAARPVCPTRGSAVLWGSQSWLSPALSRRSRQTLTTPPEALNGGL